MRRSPALAALVCLAVGTIARGAIAGGTPAGGTTTAPNVGTVTVHGARDPDKLDHDIIDFVHAVTRHGYQDSLARWNVPICPLAAGLTRERGEYFLQRISDVAREIGAPLAGEKCSPNLLVAVTGDPHELLKRWRDKSPLLFNKARGPFAVKRFMESDLAVRAWYDAGDSCAGRLASFDLQADTLNVACRSSGMASRLSRSSFRTVSTVIIVIDTKQIAGLKVGLVADYVAMLGMAELVEPETPLPVPSVLNTFFDTAENKSIGLSDWDRWFLRALYHSNPRNAAQASEIRVDMFRAAVAAEPAQ